MRNKSACSVSVVCLFVIFAVAIWTFAIVPRLDEIKYGSRSASLLEDIVKMMTPKDTLKESIEKEISSLRGSYAIYIKDLKTDKETAINAEQKMEVASLAKLYVAGRFYSLAKDDPAILKKSVALTSADKIDMVSGLANDPVGSYYFANYLVESMLNASDNIAFAMMSRELGYKNIQDFAESIGSTKTDFSDTASSARDIGNILTKIYNKDFLNQEMYDKMIEAMTITVNEDRLPGSLPDGVKVAHKIATWDGVYDDAGIVFGLKKDYVVVVMNEGADYTEAVRAIRNISKLTYDYLNK